LRSPTEQVESAVGAEETEKTVKDSGIDPGQNPGPPAGGQPDPEPVWTFRGYQLRPSEFTTAMVHFFRAEVQRANVWRQRLDITTNWAVVTTGAAISFAFSRAQAEDHRVIILDILLVSLFLWIETRRDRYYELWSYRVRLMETDFFAAMLVPPFRPSADWAESLAENLLHPRFPISLWEALGRRYRRNYMWIYFILGLAWISKVWLHPNQAASWSEIWARAAIGSLPGEFILGAGMVFNGLLLAIGVLTAGIQQAAGEILPRHTFFTWPQLNNRSPAKATGAAAWFRPSRRRQQLLAYIITERAESVSQQIMLQLQRGVTMLPGTGMYTHQSRAVLMCALTVTEVAHLKAVVAADDPQAFVIVSPVQEILGKGFSTLPPRPGA